MAWIRIYDVPVVQSPYESATILLALLFNSGATSSVAMDCSSISDQSNYMSGTHRHGSEIL